MQIIPIDKQAIPYQTTIRLAGVSYDLTFHYNLQADRFTVDLSRGGEGLVVGEPLVYGSPLFSAFYDERFPGVALVPLDPSGRSQRVGWAELGETVFLYVVEPADAAAEGVI